MRGIRGAGLSFVLLFAAACASSPEIPDGAGPPEIAGLAAKAMREGRFTEAARLYEVLVDDYPEAPEAADAQWSAAESWFRAGEMGKAKKSYVEFFKSHPLAKLGVLGQRMYDIGVRQIEEGRTGLFGLGVFTSTEDGIQTLQWITKNLPNGAQADDAFFAIGKLRMDQRSYDLAVMNFDEILLHHPQSEWTHEARYLRGLSWLRENRGPEYDRSVLVKARTDFLTYIRTVERSETLKTEYADRLADAKKKLGEVERRLAEKLYAIGRFYTTQERYESARIYLELAAREHPDSDAAREAGVLLKELPKGVE